MSCRLADSRYRALLFIGLALLLPRPARAATDENVRSALVKIYTTSQARNYAQPWDSGWVSSSTGSGCILSERRILTNAHVVSDQTLVQVRRNGHPDKQTARVLFVSHDADLALLTVDDDRFFEGVKPLEIGELPSVREEVTVLGFPMGGDTLSVTRGVVSRIEHQVYSHSSRWFLAGQIDAAVNPGNSGGPVTEDGRVVGVAFETLGGSNNIAYMIPAPVVQRFLRDVSDGSYDGVPRLGVQWQDLENPALRRKHRVPAAESGILITATYPGSPATRLLREDDVLLSVEGHPIANDGTVEFRPNERTLFSYFIDGRQVGDEIGLVFLRGGERTSSKILLRGQPGADEPVRRYDTQPSYFAFGGVIFVPLTVNYLEWTFGVAYRDAPAPLLASRSRIPTEVGEQVIVIMKVLPADLNEGYHDVGGVIVQDVDGIKPHDLRHLVELLENGPSELVTIRYGDSRQMVLERGLAKATNAKILEQYQVGVDRSQDLRKPENAVASAAGAQ